MLATLKRDELVFWTLHFSFLDCTLFRMDSTFWSVSTLKLYYVVDLGIAGVGIIPSFPSISVFPLSNSRLLNPARNGMSQIRFGLSPVAKHTSVHFEAKINHFGA